MILVIFLFGFTIAGANNGQPSDKQSFASAPFINNENTQKYADSSHKISTKAKEQKINDKKKTNLPDDQDHLKHQDPPKDKPKNQYPPKNEYTLKNQYPPKLAKENSQNTGDHPKQPNPNKEPASQNPPPRGDQAHSPPPKQNAPTTIYVVIAGSFNQQSDAENRVDQLKSKGFDAQVKQSSDNGQTTYYVEAGTFTNRADADARVQQIHNAGFNDAYVREEQSSPAPANK
jgi:N-acetylmuramoyl-L-alanine amidase